MTTEIQSELVVRTMLFQISAHPCKCLNYDLPDYKNANKNRRVLLTYGSTEPLLLLLPSIFSILSFNQNFKIVISTLRFFFLDSALALLATGLIPPYPLALSLFLSMPLSVKKFIIEIALVSDNFRLADEEP